MKLPRTSESGRVVLDQGAKTAFDQMLMDLKKRENCIRISPSKFVSWVVERYATTSFVHDQETIVKRFFDSKEYLKNRIRGAHTPEEVEAVLKTALLKVGSDDAPKLQRGHRKKKGVSDPAMEFDQLGAATSTPPRKD